MDNTLLEITIIIILIICSGFFAAAETAVTGVSQATIHRLKQDGNKRAKLVSNLRKDKERLISTLLFGNSTCNAFAVAQGTKLTIELIGDGDFNIFCATIIMTIVIFVFAEVLPKTYAFENSERFALTSAPIVSLIVKTLYPITTFVQMMVKWVLKSIGMHGKDKNHVISGADALRGAIDLHHKEGSVIKTDRDMLGSILDLGDTSVNEIMVHRRKMVTVDANLPVSKIIEQAMESTHTRIPVWRDNPDNIVGIINIKDLLKVVNNTNIDSIIAPPWFVLETTSLREQLNEFRKRRNHFALIIDEYGALLGIVTLEDILEEIVGQIEDEHDDKARHGIVLKNDGSYIIEGTTTIRDINRELDWSLPDDDAKTIGGLIMHATEIVPEQNESFELFGVKLTIMKKSYNQIVEVKAEKL